MKYKVTLTDEQWKAIDEITTEHINRFAGWLADHHEDNKADKVWLKSVKKRYEVWKDIQKSLLDGEPISD